MNIKTYNAREYHIDAFKIAKKAYPGIFISDARFLDYESQKVLAVTYQNKILPYSAEFLKNFQFCEQMFSFNSQNVLINLNANTFELDDGQQINLSISLIKQAQKVIAKFETYGGRINEKGEHIIDLKSTKIGPHFDANLLLGNFMDDEDPLLKTPKGVVNSFGGGSFRGEADFQVSATKWGVNPYENGDPMNRQFYFVEKGKQIFFSGKVDDDIETAICIHSPNYSTITYIFNQLKVTRKIFILGKRQNIPEAIEIQNITIQNLGDEDRELQIVAVGMFGFSNPDCQKVDIIYQTVINQTRIFCNEKNEIQAISPDYYPKYFRHKMRFAILRSDDGYADSFTNNLEEFLDGGTYAEPNGLLNFSNNLQRSGVSFYGLKKSFKLPKSGLIHFSDIIGASYVSSKGNVEIKDKLEKDLIQFTKSYPKFCDLEKCFEEDRNKYVDYTQFIQVKSEDSTFDSYINNTLPFQVLYQSFVSRGFAQTQKGYREIGFREIQDMFASMYYLYNEGKQNLVKTMLEYWIKNIYEFGYANHNFYFKGKEPGMCSDDQLWLVQAVYRYINLSGDKDFLSQSFEVAGSDKKRKLFDTLKAIITYSAKISIGKHKLPLLDSCDWNDCLKIDDDYMDGPTKEKVYLSYLKKSKKDFGSALKNEYSESVMNGFLLVIALKEMKEMTINYDEEKYIEELDKLIEEKETALQKFAYINGYFTRVLMNRKNVNNITYIGSKGDGLSIDDNVDGSYYLNSFSWSLLSGVATDEQIENMLNTVEKYLKTPAGFILCTNSDLSIAGSKLAATDHYYPGDRENGAVFKHAAMMAVVSMLKKSKIVNDEKLRDRLIENSFYMLDLVLPYKTLKNPYILKGNPRFCTQYNNSISMENIGPILSGTASWLTLAIYEIIGLEFTFDSIKILPVLSKESENFKVSLNLNETIIEIEIFKQKGEYLKTEELTLEVDGSKIKTLEIPRFNDKKRHVVIVK